MKIPSVTDIRMVGSMVLGLMLAGGISAAGFNQTRGVGTSTASKAEITKLQNQINILKQQLDQLRAAISVSNTWVTINKKLRVTSNVDVQGDLDVTRKITAADNIETSRALKASRVHALASIKQGNVSVVLPGHPVTGTVNVPPLGAIQLINGRVR